MMPVEVEQVLRLSQHSIAWVDRNPVIAAFPMLCWPALWNGFPVVFADTGTYLSQAIHGYAGWDRPIFYSLFMLPLHATVTVWPVVVVQALLTTWVLWLVCRVLASGVSGSAFVGAVGMLSVCTWLPWIVSEIMPDLFTPLLVLVLCLLVWLPERLSRLEQVELVALAAFMIASQQSSLPLACLLLAMLSILVRWNAGSAFDTAPVEAVLVHSVLQSRTEDTHAPAAVRSAVAHKAGMSRPHTDDNAFESQCKMPWPRASRYMTSTRRRLLMILPPALAVLSLCSVNLAAHGRFAVSPFGNVFLLARVIYDGPGMTVLRRDCPTTNWKLCPYLDSFPATSDDFLWTAKSPLKRAGGPKAVSGDAWAIIEAALLADPAGEARAALINTWEQLTRFDSGDGLNSWPAEVSPTIKRDFPAWEQAAYFSARQQAGGLSVPPRLARVHVVIALVGVMFCVLLLPIAFTRRSACTGFLFAALVTLPLGAAITGSLSAPHDRYQARIMWLPPFIAIISLASMRRQPALYKMPSGSVLGELWPQFSQAFSRPGLPPSLGPTVPAAVRQRPTPPS